VTPSRYRRTVRAVTLAALLAVTAAGCGQRGPLVLPGTQPVAQPPPPPAPDEQDDERENEG